MNLHRGHVRLCAAWFAAAAFLIAEIPASPTAGAQEEGTKERLEAELVRLETLTIAYASAAEQGSFEKERRAVQLQRVKIARYGTSALPAVMRQLRHWHVNVRRGAAILCYYIIEAAHLPDHQLLETFLRRMVQEPDLNCRSNLGHLVRLLVEDLVTYAPGKFEGKPEEVAPARQDPECSAYLARFHGLRAEQVMRSRALSEAQLSFYAARSSEERLHALAKTLQAARVLQALLEGQIARLQEGKTPDRLRLLHETHMALLETALRGTRSLLEAGEEQGPSFFDAGIIHPGGSTGEQTMLVEMLVELDLLSTGEREPESEKTYLRSLGGVIERAAAADAGFLDASRVLQTAKTRGERVLAMEGMAGALAMLVAPLEAELGKLRQLKPPKRYRDLQMAYEDVLRHEAIACRRAPPAMRSWDDRGIGRWTSLLNIALSSKRKLPDLLERLSRE